MMPKPGGVTLVFGKLQRKTSGGPGTLLCLSIVIFISRSHSSFLRTYILPQSFFFFLCPFIHITFSQDCPSPCPIKFKAIWRVIHAPPQRTLSPCRFLFPARHLSYFLFLCYQNGRLPITVCHLAELQVQSVIVLLMILLWINLLIFLIYFQMSNPRS